jgi:hypothetical protein
MRTCIFCGNSAGSREHVFAERLIERTGLKNYPVRSAYRREAEIKARPEAHRLAALVVKVVCKKCNNGWMSELESWFQRAAGCLVEPEWPKLADAMIEQLQRENLKLATWSLKTALTIDRSGMSPKIPGSIALDLFAGILPESLRVDLAHIKYPGFGCVTAPGFTTVNGDQPIGWQSRADGFAFQTVIQLNHLGIRVFCAPEAGAAYLKPDLMVIRAYPARRFSSTDNFAYESLDQFRANLLLVAGK